MTAALIMLAGLVLGWWGHKTRPLIDRLSHGWRELTASGIGVLLIYPIYLAAYWHEHRKDSHWFIRGTIIYWWPVVAIGTAVTMGWIYDTANEEVSV